MSEGAAVREAVFTRKIMGWAAISQRVVQEKAGDSKHGSRILTELLAVRQNVIPGTSAEMYRMINEYVDWRVFWFDKPDWFNESWLPEDWQREGV